MLDCMVDLETTAVLPDRGAIVQIAAVQFSLEHGTVEHNFFNRCLAIPPHRYWQESTREFWMRQKPHIFQGIMARMEDPRQVFTDFIEWCYPAGSLRLWAKPSHFEFPFIASYCNDYDLVNPFHYSKGVTDMNSFIKGLYYPDPVPELEIEFKGDPHNALYDVFHQIKTLMAHYENVKKLRA